MNKDVQFVDEVPFPKRTHSFTANSMNMSSYFEDLHTPL